MGREFSPVVKGNVRFSGPREGLHVNVWFRDRSEIQKLIDALIALRDSVGDQCDHVHLPHHDLVVGKQVGLADGREAIVKNTLTSRNKMSISPRKNLESAS